MFKELVDAIQNGVDGKEIDIGGESFTTKPVYRVPHEPTAICLAVNTLQGLIDYISQDIDSHGNQNLFVHVVNERRADVARFLDSEKRREYRLSADYENVSFRFGQKYDQATFITLLQSQFIENDGRTKLQQIVGGLTDESSLHLVDDGISQKTTAKVGITVSERITTPNPFKLAPFRTFPEITQPVSDFILRLHRQPESVPLVSLHECDNQAWKLEAIKSIKEFLRADAGFTLADIPIIA